LNAKQEKESARNSWTLRTPVIVVTKSDRWMACVGIGSVSSLPFEPTRCGARSGDRDAFHLGLPGWSVETADGQRARRPMAARTAVWLPAVEAFFVWAL
jgi:hypothetical protein